MLPNEPVISIVDDDQSVRQSLTRLMKSLGYAVADFRSADDFLASPFLARTSCLIADVNMPGMTGIELYRSLIEAGRAIPTILITAYPDDAARAGAAHDGLFGYLTKPFREADLIHCVHSALRPGKPPDANS